MELQHLKAFYEVAKQGSVSAAAGVLRITQPSVSRGVQNLEESLGLTLFTRLPRGVALTDEGRRVFERCQVIFQECAAIENKSAGVAPLRVAASENLCIHALPGILAGLGAGEIDVFSGGAEEVIQSVLAGQADFGYCYHPSKMPGLSSVAICEVEFWLIGPRKSSLRELESMPFVGSFSRQYQGPYAAKALLAEAGLRPALVRQCNSQEAQVQMVKAGLGYSLVPWFLVKGRAGVARIATKKKLGTPLFRISRVGESSRWMGQIDEALRKRVAAQ